MDLLQNPFHILNASPRDNRRRLMELADERSLLLDSSECMKARSDLTNPRKRLSAEVAWLLGLSPKNAMNVLGWLEKPGRKNIPKKEVLSILTPIARTNLLAAGLARLSDHNANDMAEWILEISWAFEDLDADELSVIINEERVVSGFPEVSDLSAVEAEIQERRRHYRQVIKSALDNLSPKELVEAVTVAVESATNDGKAHGPVLIADLVDSYEVEAQRFLDKEEANIRTLVEKLRAAVDAEQPDSTLAPMVNQLIQIVKNWDTVAQPIQVSTKSRGLDHDASYRVAGLVRGLAIHMFNEHDKLDFSQQLTNLLQEAFAEVGEVAERAAEDADLLSGEEEWQKEITYEADIGAIFKDKLSISPQGIKWKRHHWCFDSITRIRWGGTRHSIGGIPTGTIYSISFGNDSSYVSIKLKKEVIFSNFIDRLWRAVGVRLLKEYLEGLRDGKKYRFGSVVMSDHGIEFENKKLFGSNEQVFCRWDELEIRDGAGVFCIEKKEDKKLSAAFSYQKEDNLPVLQVAIRMFWERGGDRLSSLLEY